MAMGIKEMMAKRAAEEIKNGNVVNLGFGIPQKVINYIPEEMTVFVHAENGILGAGPAAEAGKEDPTVVDSGCVAITAVPGASFFDSADSFGLIRSGKLDITILGALEVAENGDLANWMVPGGKIPGMGGAMDLAKKSARVVVITTQMDKKGNSKLKEKCEFPLTADKCVSLIITDMGVIEVNEDGYLLTELFEGHTAEEVIAGTDAHLNVAENLRVIRYEEQ